MDSGIDSIGKEIMQMGSVEEFNKRRDARMRAKDGREDDQWITMKGTHVLIDDGGQVSKGPDKLKKVVKSGGGYKAKSKMEKDADKFHKELQSWNDVDFPEDTSEAVDMEKSEKKRMEDKLNEFSRLMHEPDREENKEYSYGSGDEPKTSKPSGSGKKSYQYNGHDIGTLRKEYKKMLDEHGGSITNKEYKAFQDKYGLNGTQAQNIMNYWSVGAGAKQIAKEKGSTAKTSKPDYGYGSGNDRGKKYEKIARSLKQYNKHEYPVEWKKAAEQWNDAYDKASAEEKKIMHKILKDYGL